MPWNPDNGSPLQSAAVSVTDVERTSMSLWAEYLSGWFDGGPHIVRGVPTTVPALQANGITFQEQDIPPLDGLALQVTSERSGRVWKCLYGDGSWNLLQDMQVNFWFRALVKTPRSDGHNSRSLVRWGADTLYAILTSHLHQAQLVRKGIQRIVPLPPTLVSGGITAIRLVPIQCRYFYPLNELLGSAQTLPGNVSGITNLSEDLRVGPNGLECKAVEDGQWYAVGPTPPDVWTVQLAPQQ